MGYEKDKSLLFENRSHGRGHDISKEGAGIAQERQAGWSATEGRQAVKRIAIYARYSSDLQDEKSIDRQLHDCRRFITQRWSKCKVTEFTDAKISGAFDGNRPAFLRLMKAIYDEQFDIVIAEHLDRLARDPEALARLYKCVKHAEAELVMVNGGNVTQMHIAFEGVMGAMYLENLSHKTRSGIREHIASGKHRGEAVFGYDEAPGGKRIINSEEAAIVRRIFGDFSSGLSPIRIARQLNAEQVFRRGKPWTSAGIYGNHAYGTGLLNNELYIGRYIWNRLRYPKDPVTGARVPRVNPQEQWVIQLCPELRILTDRQWASAKDKQAFHSTLVGPSNAFRGAKRAMHDYSGLIKCTCGECFVYMGPRLECTGFRNGRCTVRSIRRRIVETRIRRALHERVMSPAALKELTRAVNRHIAEERKRLLRTDTAALERTIAKLIADGERLLDLAEKGLGDFEGLKARMLTNQARRKELEHALAEAKAAGQPASKPLLHPKMVAVYTRKISALLTELDRDTAESAAAREAIRGLIREIHLKIDPKAEDGWAIVMCLNQPAILSAAGVRDTQSWAPTCPSLCIVAA